MSRKLVVENNNAFVELELNKFIPILEKCLENMEAQDAEIQAEIIATDLKYGTYWLFGAWRDDLKAATNHLLGKKFDSKDIEEVLKSLADKNKLWGSEELDIDIFNIKYMLKDIYGFGRELCHDQLTVDEYPVITLTKNALLSCSWLKEDILKIKSYIASAQFATRLQIPTEEYVSIMWISGFGTKEPVNASK